METEAKFIVPNEDIFIRLREVERFGLYVRRDTTVKKVHDRYVDTPDHRFYSNKFYARLRQGKESGNLLFTLKRLEARVEGAIHARDEYETEVPGLQIVEWPESEVQTLAKGIAGDQPLKDLVIVDQVRTVSHLYQDTRAVAECSLDEIIIQTINEPLRAYEMEIELLPDGTLSDLRTLGEILAEVYGLAPQPLSKFERALRLSNAGAKVQAQTLAQPAPQVPALTPAQPQAQVTPRPFASTPTQTTAQAPDAPPQVGDNVTRSSTEPASEPPAKGLQQSDPASLARPAGTRHYALPEPASKSKQPMGVLPTDRMEAAGRKILAVHFEAMLANEEGTRTGEDAEALHDMRVATRRMRAALQVLDPYMKGKSISPVKQGLRATTRALGVVRDFDVLVSHAQQFHDGLPADKQEDMAGLLAEWEARRERLRERMLRHLDSKDYARFKKSMEAFLNEEDAPPPDQKAGATPYQVRHVAGSAIWSRYEAVRAFETLMSAPTIEQLHALRIGGKYLRYTLECFRETLATDASNLIRDVVKMQDQLGELHDADVAAGLVRAHISRLSKVKKGKKNKKAEQAEQAELMEPASKPPPADLYAYLEEREATVRRIYADFPKTWAYLADPKWRARLTAAIASL